MMVLGAILNLIGNKTPIVKTYLGGGAIVVIFGSAALFTYGILPEYTKDITTNFMKGEGFLNFYIAALITGSILGMNSTLLKKAFLKYIPAILGGVIVAILLTGTVGLIIGYGFSEAVLYIAVPIMGGGMGAGAVPLAEIFAEKIPTMTVEETLSIMVPALALGNAMAIVAAGLLNRLGKGKPALSGEGKLIRDGGEFEVDNSNNSKMSYVTFGKGILVALSFYIFGLILGELINPRLDKIVGVTIHPYALMIIAVAIVKIVNIMPKEYSDAADHWYRFVAANFTSALLVGIGVAYIDLGEIYAALSVQYVLLVFVTVIGAIIGAGVVGHFVGFYPIESSITAGLCMANMGGTGDVAVLSASDRMDMMPFAQISSRIGGALIIILATILIGILL